MISKSLFALMLGMGVFVAANAQQSSDTVTATKQFKNIIRYNISGPILFGFNYIVFGYERVLNDKQSISVNVGQSVLPKVINFTSAEASLEGTQNNTGFNVSADYRFYLQKENKYKAPRGVYIGPYYSFNKFKRDSQWKLNEAGGTTNANANTSMNIHTIGFELGYQFMLGKRIALDFVLAGPGIANYKIKSVFDNDLTPAQKEKLLSAIEQMLAQKFPGMDYVLNNAGFDANGNFNTWNVGFRYMIHIGFRF